MKCFPRVLQSPSSVQLMSVLSIVLYGVGTSLYGVDDKTLLIANLASFLASLLKHYNTVIGNNTFLSQPQLSSSYFLSEDDVFFVDHTYFTNKGFELGTKLQ